MKITGPVADATRATDRAVMQRDAAESTPQRRNDRLQDSPAGTQGQISRNDLEKIVEKMNTAAGLFSRALQFKMLEGNRLIIKVIDTATDEVLSEFPPERLVEAFRSMEASLGLLVDKKV